MFLGAIIAPVYFMKYKTTIDFFKERMSKTEKIGLVNLGCARNLVDSQVILGELKYAGHRIVDIAQADVAVVNTCGFIEEAKKESLDTILDLIELKKQGKLKAVVVAGCLAQRYAKELTEEFGSDVDAIIGTLKMDREKIPVRFPLTPKHFAYVKICESCFNQCHFCIIPKIKGKFLSRTCESVVEEVKNLDAQGVKEILIIGQDITAYGMDIYRQKSLARLLREIIKVSENIQWIRLLYAFPAHVTDDLIEIIAAEEKICKYIDMPLQHISDHILKGMNRGIGTLETRQLLEKIRKKIPQASLRTTFIVGLPGEREEDFEELVSFVKEQQFEKVGVFVYSREEGTSAYAMADQVPEHVKRNRLKKLMKAQQEISSNIQRRMIGRTLHVLIDEPSKNEDNVYLGRTEYDAPEVDGLVYVHTAQKRRPGDLVKVRISDAYEYDLVGQEI